MRALAHPVRVALIEELTFQTIHSGRGMTATELGEAIGETATTCSFHLRQLAKYGFVEEAGGGRGRARPWRMKSVSMFFAPSDDPGAQIASDAALRLFRERQFARYQAWRSTKATYPEEWRNASSDSEYTFYATPEELDQLNKDLHAQLMRFWERNADPSKRPAGALPVETLLLNYPIAVPRPADDGQSPDDEDGGDEDRDDEDRDEDG
jgi:hypothetical protein